MGAVTSYALQRPISYFSEIFLSLKIVHINMMLWKKNGYRRRKRKENTCADGMINNK